eukprot:765326-Hanusia_phi.AAC.4
MAAAEPPSSGEVHDPCAGSQRDGGEAEVFYRESGFFRLLGPEELRGAQGEEPGGSAGAAEDERGAGGRVCEQRIRRDPGEGEQDEPASPLRRRSSCELPKSPQPSGRWWRMAGEEEGAEKGGGQGRDHADGTGRILQGLGAPLHSTPVPVRYFHCLRPLRATAAETPRARSAFGLPLRARGGGIGGVYRRCKH